MKRPVIFTLLPPFYDETPEKDQSVYIKQIEGEFGIAVKKYHYDKYSFGSDVFTVNDEYIFRFPRTYIRKEYLQYEIALLAFLKNKVKIAIPDYIFVSEKKDFGGYKIIPGKPLDLPSVRYISQKNKLKMTNQLIEFINTFHTIPVAEFEIYKPVLKREDFVSIEKRIEKELYLKLFPKLSKNDRETISTFYAKAKKLMQSVSHSCPTHGDLYGWNTIWDKRTGEIGVIDFSDYMITDPARDFEVFYDLGPDYAELAYNHYTGKKDPNFLKRAEIYWKLHGIYTLLSSLLGANISFEYAYNNYFKKKF